MMLTRYFSAYIYLSLSLSGFMASPVLATETTQASPQQSPVSFAEYGGANTQTDSHDMWLALKEQHFKKRNIIESDQSRIQLNAPKRAENDALVPVAIQLKPTNTTHQQPDPFTKLYLVVDVNPAPMGGIFSLASNRQMEQLTTMVRVNGYTYIRAIGETASGKLYMDKQWVKSTGAGCSAPPGMDQEAHKKRLGKMRFKFKKGDNLEQSQTLQLIISHPNNTGMQRDQLTTMMIPEHYVKHIKVTFNDTPVLAADTSFTLSENPKFSFNFAPDESGILRAEITDNLNYTFWNETAIDPRQ